jgi:hypothetical protein
VNPGTRPGDSTNELAELPPKPDAMPSPSALPARVRVLLVEDDEDDALLTRSMFDDIDPARFEVEWTPEYRRGIERLCEGCHDVCLVDYQLGLLRQVTGAPASATS